ncbi:MAG: hypothetical protein ACMG6H_14270 [Acidobacteriota bacterium]
MHIVRIEHSVPDFDKWKEAFELDPAGRKASGVRRYQVLRLKDDPNYVMIDLEFDTIDEAQAFLERMQQIWSGPAKSVMRNPSARIAERVEQKEV